MHGNGVNQVFTLGSFGQNISETWQRIPEGFRGLGILLAGLLVALLTRLLVGRVLEKLRFNQFCDRTDISEFLRKGKVRYSPARLVGLLLFWLVLLVTVLWAHHAVGGGLAKTLLTDIQTALPIWVKAIGVFIVGYALVAVCANVLGTISRNAGFPYASLLAGVVKWLGLLLVSTAALEQVGIAVQVIITVLQIVLGAAALALALAFGLGCKDLARDAMQKFLEHLRERHRNTGPDLEG